MVTLMNKDPRFFYVYHSDIVPSPEYGPASWKEAGENDASPMLYFSAVLPRQVAQDHSRAIGATTSS